MSMSFLAIFNVAHVNLSVRHDNLSISFKENGNPCLEKTGLYNV